MLCCSEPFNPDQDRAHINYMITIKTSGAYLDAGTNSKIELQFFGDCDNEKTSKIELNQCFETGLNTGKKLTVNRQLEDVGNIIMLTIRLKNCLCTDVWLCDWIEVTVHHERFRFPIYSFIESEAQVCTGKASLPQNQTDWRLILQRENEIESNKKEFRWKIKNDDYKGLPRHGDFDSYSALPNIFKRYTVRERDFVDHALKGIILSNVETIKRVRTPIKSLEDYHTLSNVLPPPTNNLNHDWEKDSVQGWQMLNGVYPTAYELCKEIPSYFNVTNEALKDIIGGKTIEDLIKKEELYISDFSKVFGTAAGVKRVKGSSGRDAVCPPAVALFLNDSKGFRPIAIQLKPDDPEYLFVADSGLGWLLAKMYYRCCVSNYHEWVMHFLYTHNVMEPFCISLFRCLPRCHPVYKLLRPHLRTVVAINTNARSDLLSTTTIISYSLSTSATSLTRYVYKSFQLQDLNISKVLEKKGIKPANFTNNWYATDALAIWNAIQKYVTHILNIYYKNEEDVENDFELQGWNKDLAEQGFECTEENDKGFSLSGLNMEQLVEICTIVIYTASAQHSAVNFGQYQTYRFAPSSPGIMNKEVPKNTEDITMKRILESLPSTFQADLISGLTNALSQFSEADVYLGNWEEKWFTEYEAIEAQSEFKHQCELLHHEIKMRNRKLDRKYKYLDPVQVPNSIAI